MPACRVFQLSCNKGRGRSGKTWGDCVDDDLRLLGLKREWEQDRVRD